MSIKVTLQNGLPLITISILKRDAAKLPKTSYENAQLFGTLRNYLQITTSSKEKALDYMNELDILAIPYKAKYN